MTMTVSTSAAAVTAASTKASSLFHQRVLFFVTCLTTLLVHCNFLTSEQLSVVHSFSYSNLIDDAMTKTPLSSSSSSTSTRTMLFATTPTSSSHSISEEDPATITTTMTTLLINYTIDQGYDIIEPHIMNMMMPLQSQQQQQQQQQHSDNNNNPRTTIYVITPTYQRQTQMVDLTRLSQTLSLANIKGHQSGRYQIYWIVIEDHDHCTKRVRDIAERTNVLFAHVYIKTTQHTNKRHRGVEQRNLALDIIGKNLMDGNDDNDGIIYFADDDNAYDVRVFDEIRRLDVDKYNVGIFGVAFRGGKLYSRCTVDQKTGLVDDILSDYQRKQPQEKVSTNVVERSSPVPQNKQKDYAMDMAGFCVSTNVLKKQKQGDSAAVKRFDYNWESGSLESNFLKYVGGINKMSDFQPLANNCTQILVWHVKTTTGYENKKSLSLASTDQHYNSIQPSV